MHGIIKPLTTLCCALLCCGSLRAAGPEQLQAFLANTQSARASFSQSVVAKSGRKPQLSQGSFLFARPGKFRLSYDQPYQQLIVGDGERLWVYDADLNQVSVKKMDQALGASPAALLSGGKDMEKNFLLSDAGVKDGLEWVDAKPRSADSGFVGLRLGFREQLPQVLQVTDNFGQTTTMRFTNFERNPSLGAGTFQFTPPKGADVLKE